MHRLKRMTSPRHRRQRMLELMRRIPINDAMTRFNEYLFRGSSPPLWLSLDRHDDVRKYLSARVARRRVARLESIIYVTIKKRHVKEKQSSNIYDVILYTQTLLLFE